MRKREIKKTLYSNCYLFSKFVGLGWKREMTTKFVNYDDLTAILKFQNYS